MRGYLKPIEVAQIVQLLWDDPCACAIRRLFAECSRIVSRGWKSRTGIFSFVWGGTEWLPEPCKVTFLKATHVHFSDQNLKKHTAWRWLEVLMSFSGIGAHYGHHAAWLAFTSEHQNWEVQHWCTFSLQMREVSHWTHVMDVNESGDAVTSMAGLTVDQWLCGEAFTCRVK